VKEVSTENRYPDFFEFLTKTGLPTTVSKAVCFHSATVSIENGNSYNPIESDIAFFYIKSGLLIEENVLSNGTVISSYLYGAGSILFVPTVLSDSNRNFISIYKAFCNLELVLVNLSSFKMLSKQYPMMFEYVHKGYAEQSMMERECAWFINILDKRSLIIATLLSFGLQSEGLTFSASLEQISVMLNISRQHVNSIVNELVRKEYLEKNQNELHIISPEGMISLLPDSLTDTIKTLAKLSIFNLDGCFFGKCAPYINESGWTQKPND